MSLFYNLREGVSGAINYVVDKNRKISLINRIKSIIRTEEHNANQAYIALGKYYFHNLRDAKNGETEFYCLEVDHANRRISRAMMKLDELTEDETYFYEYDQYNREPEDDFDDACMGCSDSCDSCGCYEGMNPGTDWDNIAAIHQMQKERARAQYAAEHPEDLDSDELEVELDEALKDYLNAKIKENKENSANGTAEEPPLF